MAKFAAIGTALKYEDPDNAGTYITVAQAKDISGPERETEEINVTTQDSSNYYHEYIPGLKDGGSVSFDLVFDPDDAASQADLNELLEDRTVLNWQLVFPSTNGAMFEFSGFVSNFSVEAPVDDALMASVTIRVTGKPTLDSNPT